MRLSMYDCLLLHARLMPEVVDRETRAKRSRGKKKKDDVWTIPGRRGFRVDQSSLGLTLTLPGMVGAVITARGRRDARLTGRVMFCKTEK